MEEKSSAMSSAELAGKAGREAHNGFCDLSCVLRNGCATAASLESPFERRDEALMRNFVIDDD
jgi:hypothetical protein